MQHHANPQLAEALASRAIDGARAKAKRLAGGIVEVLAICANAWAAAKIYEERTPSSRGAAYLVGTFIGTRIGR